MRTAIILINYFKEHELIEFVKTCLLTQLNPHRHVYVVDNGSHSDALKELQDHQQITLLNPGKNLGYFGAASFARQYLLEMNGDPEYFVVSNFDLDFDKEIFIDQMETVCERIDACVVGPDIMSSLSGRALNPMYQERLSLGKIRLLFWVTTFYPLFFIYQWLHKVKSKRHILIQDNKQSGSVYAVHGSFIVFKKEYFKRGGNLAFGSFLYGEELFVAEECRRMGCKPYFESSLKIVHREHTTTGIYKNAKHMKWLHQSIGYIRNKYYVH